VFLSLRTPRLLLRPLHTSDTASLVAYRSLPEVARYQSWDSYTFADAEALIAKLLNVIPNTPGTWFQLGIEEQATGELIGDCGLHFRGDEPQQVELGITLAPSRQKCGYATEALRAVLEYLFEMLGKHRVSAVTDVENQTAANLLRRLGFRQEGHFVEHVWYKGAWGSEFLFALLRRDWLAQKLPASAYNTGS
jgi:RimJ/RimL family protein N-acetyltransferase